MIKSIDRKNLPQLWERLSSHGDLFLPVREGLSLNYRPWKPDTAVDLDSVNSTVSPKEIFLPRDEVYLQFRQGGNEQDLELKPASVEAGLVTAFGLRPCDLRAVELLDLVFRDQEPGDELYTRRRENTTVVALACGEPDSLCFCTAFEIDPADAPGADVMAWWDGDELLMKARTDKGEALLGRAGELLNDSNSENKPLAGPVSNFGLQLEGLPGRLKERFEDDVWDRLYRSCLGCGACTYLCPTCHCFDVEDYGCREHGERFRCWDSCMYGRFTLMAGGHNPRPTRKERVRNRFLHKLQYFPENYGAIACVGCGRCLRSCPVNLDMVQAVRALGGETVDKR